VLFSLLVARLITPMMAAYLMSSKDGGTHEQHKDSIFMRGYLAMIKTTTATLRLGRLKFGVYYLTLVGAFVAFGISMYFMLQVPGSFIPPEDSGRISISVELPPGTTLAQTDKVSSVIYDHIKGTKWVDQVFILGGSSPTGELDIRRATVTVLLDKLDHSLLLKLSDAARSIPGLDLIVPRVENKGRTVPQNVIEAEIFAQLKSVPDIRAIKLNDRGAKDITFNVLAPDDATLTEAVTRLETALRGDPLLANVAAEGALPRPEIQVRPRHDEAARLGISTQSIASVLRIATIGDYDAALAKVSLDGRQIPVRVRLNDAIRQDLNRISNLKITTASGASVPLSAVADISVSEGPATVKRLNRERQAEIGANLPVGVALGTATIRFKEILEATPLPAGARAVPAGDAEVQAELFSSFLKAMFLGLLLVLTVLILLFRSVIQPFTILASLPLAIGGVAAALLLTGSALSMPVLIGILMLMGIVTKNAILLVDFAIEMRAQGMERIKAVVEAGHKRAQPIVMTSIAMSAGMLPSALGVGEGGSFRSPMATAVIGGIIVSTVLSLIVVPSFYLIMDDISYWISKLFGRFIGPKEVEPEAPAPEILAERIALLSAEQSYLREKLNAMGKDAPPPALRAAE
jgi:multidrug efflux pump subunit AcrB